MAARRIDFSGHAMRGPLIVPGKDGEAGLADYELNLDHLWRPGPRRSGAATFLKARPVAGNVSTRFEEWSFVARR